MITRRLLLLAAAAALPCAAADPRVVILLGGPGSGKTTQAEFLKQKYKLPYFSAETLMKKSHDRKSKESKKISGVLAPDEVLGDQGMSDLFREAIIKADNSQGFVLDGYPASRTQAASLAGLLAELKMPDPILIHLDAPDAVLVQRLSARGKKADKPEIIQRRIEAFRAEEKEVLTAYPQNRVFRIDATQSPEAISQAVASALTGL